MKSICDLVRLAVNLDVGTVHASTVPIVLFVLRLVSRVDSYVSFLINHSCRDDESIFWTLRDVQVLPETLTVLVAMRDDLVRTVRAKVCPMIEEWCTQLVKETIDKGDDEVVDANARTACQLHAHLLLLHRNIDLEDYDFTVASTITSSFLYLTSRHTWNLNLLGIPEHQVFEMLMVQRRKLLAWVRQQRQNNLTELMEATVRVTVSTGLRRQSPDDSLALKPSATSKLLWAYIDGERSVGRFTVASARHDNADNEDIPVINPKMETGIEVDLQVIQILHFSSFSSDLICFLLLLPQVGTTDFEISPPSSAGHSNRR